MDFNVCVDIGNTKIKSAIFVNDDIVELIYGLEDLIDRLNKVFKLNHKNRINCIVSSTRKNIPNQLKDLQKSFNVFIELDHNTKLPIKLDYKTPETLGRDRIAGAVGAKKIFPDKNCIVVDAGTCVTYDFVDKDNVFRGGNISPGIHMRINAMNQFTDNLPIVELKINDNILGKSTEEALQNGAVRGTFLEISSFIQLILDKYGSSELIFTGGDAKYFVNYFNSTIFANQNLVLVGLNEILNKYE